jgi:hypothetical protein
MYLQSHIYKNIPVSYDFINTVFTLYNNFSRYAGKEIYAVGKEASRALQGLFISFQGRQQTQK